MKELIRIELLSEKSRVGGPRAVKLSHELYLRCLVELALAPDQLRVMVWVDADNPAVQRVKDMLISAGHIVIDQTVPCAEPSIRFSHSLVFDENDEMASLYVQASPNQHRLSEAIEVGDGVLRAKVSQVETKVPLGSYSPDYRALTCSAQVKLEIEKAQLINVGFVEVEMIGKASEAQRTWKLVAKEVLPPIVDGYRSGEYVVYDGYPAKGLDCFPNLFFDPAVYRYRKSALAGMTSDLVISHEEFGRGPNRAPIYFMTPRFVRLCRGLKLDISFRPIILVD